MKISLRWLQNYFEEPLPSAEVIADSFTFHAFEIEESNGDLMEVNVLPNRAADCLSHRGLAKELAAIRAMPLSNDPLRLPIPPFPTSEALKVEIEDPKKCLRYSGALVRGVKVGPSPAWLRDALSAVGQRSINNVVDATNYVMLNIGQPLHAFDAAKLMQKDGTYSIGVRQAHEGEKITLLSGEEHTLPSSILLITDAHADRALGIAGVKGGAAAELTEETTDIIVESANFDGTTTRRAAQTLKLFTDASLRFQNRPSPELVAYGMRDVLALITEIAGGNVAGVTDVYPELPVVVPVSVSLTRINGVLGSSFSTEEVSGVFQRLGFDMHQENEIFAITPPKERTDLTLPEDLVEEVGRIIGYDQILPVPLPLLASAPDQARFRGIERVKDFLTEQGFTEISTQSFAKKGDIMLANPLDKNMPALRTTLDDTMQVALAQAKQYAPLLLAPNQKLKLFEVGTVFTKEGEQVVVQTSEPVPDVPRMEAVSDYMPKRYQLGAYQPFSVYPFVVRDISMWIIDTDQARGVVFAIFAENGAGLLRQVQLLDQFTNKEGRQSLAFRLIFQSFERTLTDNEVNECMTAITAALLQKGYEVR
ncbi:MAG TPA: phenylalanine--tRNA ligase subunit beta [Candidatus Paceibacterota bacterium]|nr:phenylalanine--tRNA ligase subunit beta [Candidatus Paceibacterota bacterium]